MRKVPYNYPQSLQNLTSPPYLLLVAFVLCLQLFSHVQSLLVGLLSCLHLSP